MKRLLLIMVSVLALATYSPSAKAEVDLESVCLTNYIGKNLHNIVADSRNSIVSVNKTALEISRSGNISNRWGISLTHDEIDLLAKIVWVEARGECDEGKQAVVEVIFNRIISDDFPNTLVEVLCQDKQFSSWEIKDTATPGDDIYNAIYAVINGETDILSEDVIFFARIPLTKNIYKVIGNHYFCK